MKQSHSARIADRGEHVNGNGTCTANQTLVGSLIRTYDVQAKDFTRCTEENPSPFLFFRQGVGGEVEVNVGRLTEGDAVLYVLH
ncbi:MAG: hypothetical protein ACR5K7_06070 [Symbiopectobacterium sp.]